MAKHIPRHFINELVARCELVDLIQTRVALKKRGVNFIACCPFHNEKTPSFTVSPAKQIYHCFGCGVSGNAIGFLMALENVEFPEAVVMLAEHLGVVIPYETTETSVTQETPKTDFYQVLDRVQNYYQRQLFSQKHEFALNYLTKRGITHETIKRFQLGYAPSGWDNLSKPASKQLELQEALVATGMLIRKGNGHCHDRFYDRIMFPIQDRRGRVIAFGGRIINPSTEGAKYLNSPETPLFHKSHELYGLYQARQTPSNLSSVVVVEGYMDVLALSQAGITNVVATLGTAATIEHFRILARYSPHIIFCFDGDMAGKKAAGRALETILPFVDDGIQVNFVFLPEAEDPDSLVQKEGADNFKKRLQTAISLSDFFFQYVGEQADISTLDGKAKFSQLALPLLNKMPKCILAKMMQKRLAAILRLDVEELKFNQSSREEKKKVGPKNINRLTPLRLISILSIQYPELIEQLQDIKWLEEIDLSGKEFLFLLIDLFAKAPNLTTGSILEHLRGTAFYETAQKLSKIELAVPADKVTTEFQGAILRLGELVSEQKVDYLISKANQIGLTTEERKALQNLITNKHLLDKS